MDTGFTSIEWTATPTATGLAPGYTFNPWIGCTKVSPGCEHCYAEARMDTWLGKASWGPGNPRVRTSADNWEKPLRWNRQAAAEGVRRKVFCASLADVFDNEVPQAWRTDLFELIGDTPNLDWLLLTKRIGNAREMIDASLLDDGPKWPWHNVWLGATVVNQEEADRDIPKLLTTPAEMRFLSIEPILGQIDLTNITRQFGESPRGICVPVDPWREHNALTGVGISQLGFERSGGPRIDWVIVGGESGPKARPTELGHIRRIVMDCAGADVPVFVKQIGAQPRSWCRNHLLIENAVDRINTREDDFCDNYDAHEQGRHCNAFGRRCMYLEHSKGGDPAEWPEDLRVREFPRA